MSGQRLSRDLDHSVLGGVLAGIARHQQVDLTLLRLLAVISIFLTGGVSAIVYVGAWILLPRPDHIAADPSAQQHLRERLRPGSVGSSLREASDAARRGADRVAEAARMASEAAHTATDAARTAADAARTVAEELSDIAHPGAEVRDGADRAPSREDGPAASGDGNAVAAGGGVAPEPTKDVGSSV